MVIPAVAPSPMAGVILAADAAPASPTAPAAAVTELTKKAAFSCSATVDALMPATAPAAPAPATM